MANHLKTGKIGEELACQFLISKGYEIWETNWRFRRSEIDIIARDGQVLVFVEVKTRTYDHFGKPESFISRRKKVLLIDGANAYLRKMAHDGEIRFDIIGILLGKQKRPELRHFADAFFPGLD